MKPILEKDQPESPTKNKNMTLMQDGDEILRYELSKRDGKMKKVVKRIVKQTVYLNPEQVEEIN